MPGAHIPAALCCIPCPWLQVVSGSLLPPSDLHAEPAVSAVVAAVAAAGPEGGAARGAGTLLRSMQPSARTLAALRAWLEVREGATGAWGLLT